MINLTTEPFAKWRSHVEMVVLNRFVANGTSYWVARDLAMDLVRRTKGLAKLHRQGASAIDVGEKIAGRPEMSPTGAFAVKSKSGRVVRRFATRAAAERFVRGHRTSRSPGNHQRTGASDREYAKAVRYLAVQPNASMTFSSNDLAGRVGVRRDQAEEEITNLSREGLLVDVGGEQYRPTARGWIWIVGKDKSLRHFLPRSSSPNRHDEEARLLRAWHEASAAVNRAKQAFDEAQRTDMRKVEPARKALYRAVAVEQRAHRKVGKDY